MDSRGDKRTRETEYDMTTVAPRKTKDKAEDEEQIGWMVGAREGHLRTHTHSKRACRLGRELWVAQMFLTLDSPSIFPLYLGYPVCYT